MNKATQNLIQVAMAYRGQLVTEPILPPLYIIEPTNVCNYRCVMCPHQYYTSDQKGYMQWELYKSIVDQIVDVARSVQLYWVGESTFHPRLPEMISYLKQHSVANVILSTNASILTETRAKELIDSGLDELLIALDANSASTYEKIRVLGNWDKVIANVERFFELLGERKRPKPILQLIQMQENAHEAEDFIERWSKYPCEPLVTWLDTWANQFPEMSTWSDYLCPNISLPRQPCAELWFKMVINWRGQVAICCHDWSWQHIIGDLNNQTVEEVWNSDSISQLRYLHHNNRYDEVSICNNCPEWSVEEEQYEFFGMVHLKSEST